MNKEPVLVIMAAGMGSRFGGLKQITPVDEQGHALIDYSLYDACSAGFRKVVFIIKKQIEEDFKKTVGQRMERFFDVKYVFQELDKLPEGIKVPEGRVKPWGTGHAILCAAEAIDGPFVVINADDYYGPESFRKIYNFLKEDRKSSENAMVGFEAKNTLTENGFVSRGVCETENGFLTKITERTKIEKRGNDAAFTENGTDFVDLPGETLVSMNLWGFQKSILDEYEKGFKAFLAGLTPENESKAEFYVTAIIDKLIREGKSTVEVLPTSDMWHGVTYMEDLPNVKAAIAEMKERALYPSLLWMEPSAAYHFKIEGAPFSMVPHGCGHINHTFLLTTTSGKRYILQKISEAFDIPGMMGNIKAVTEHISRKISDPRESMHLIMTVEGDTYYKNDEGSYRIYDYVEDSFCLQQVENEEDFYQSALAFGKFGSMLEDFPAETLVESIKNFHHTPDRYRIFKETIAKNPHDRVKLVQPEIDFCLAREEAASVLQNMRESGELPLRVTHNDTKLNNVIFDKNTRKGICVVDLDTVMPGLSAIDFGDAIRFAACTAAEDERDLSKMKINLSLFRIYVKGFLETSTLTEKEIEMLPMGAKIVTLETGVRFLTDYIDGDNYFSIHREGHNLDRARTQFKLVAEMEAHWDEMVQIVKEEAEAAKK